MHFCHNLIMFSKEIFSVELIQSDYPSHGFCHQLPTASDNDGRRLHNLTFHPRIRSRSRSPGAESRSRHHQLPPELLRHLEYGLVDPPPAVAMRGEIPYTNVETANARGAHQPR